jgi:hypothetical protein
MAALARIAGEGRGEMAGLADRFFAVVILYV